MAVVLPFRGFRYAQPAGADLSALIAPPYDVVGAAQRAQLLAAAAHNVIALELPEGSLDPQVPGNRYATGRQRWQAWCRTGVLAADPLPAIYVLEQRYVHQGVARARRAFLAGVQLEPFAAGVILPHERTLPKAIDDRLQLTRATAANLSPVFGLYADPGQRLVPLLAQAMATAPLAVATGSDGVQATLWGLTDAAAHATLAACLADQPLYIADGHHRYTTALAYRDECRAASGAAAAHGVAPWDTVMMALVNMDDPGLVVWPTHRLARGGPDFAPATFWQRLAERFTLTPVADATPTAALAAASGPALLVRSRDGRTCLAVLRGDQDHGAAFPAATSAAWRQLDVAVLQELILWPLLQIHPDHPETLARLAFTHDDREALAAAPEHDAVFVLRPVQVAQVAAVAQGGQTMPQKSTYFYPKLPSGLVFKSLA